MDSTVLVALSATKAPWSTNFREYCREHTTDISVEVIVNVRSLLHPSHRQYDVLVIDDMMRLVVQPKLQQLTTVRSTSSP
jgi:hypothetical protein